MDKSFHNDRNATSFYKTKKDTFYNHSLSTPHFNKINKKQKDILKTISNLEEIIYLSLNTTSNKYRFWQIICCCCCFSKEEQDEITLHNLNQDIEVINNKITFGDSNNLSLETRYNNIVYYGIKFADKINKKIGINAYEELIDNLRIDLTSLELLQNNIPKINNNITRDNFNTKQYGKMTYIKIDESTILV